jgi:CMP-N,N'-diacetyllegionaminic acid synthase
MRAGKRILVVVPARGGSKGIPLKNLQPFDGKPLVAAVGEVVARLDWVDRAVVSTDHLLIRDAAVAAGLEAPFLRPPELSGDRIGDVPVLAHALEATEADDGQRYDVVVMLQPTSPLRTPAHVTATVDKLLDESLDAAWTVSPTDLKYHPLKQLVIGPDGRMDYFDARGADIIARQQLAPVYHRNGVAYALTRECLLEQQSLMGRRSGAVVIEDELVSIDTPEDLSRAVALLREQAREPVAKQGARPRRLVVDIDGVLAAARTDGDYAAAEPMRDNIARLNALHAAGCEVVLFTARGSATGLDWGEVTRGQLSRWGVRYHALHFGKPHADYYIDDRALGLYQALAMCGLNDPVE